MPTNIEEFTKVLQGFVVNTIPEFAVETQQKVANDALRKLVSKTPRDTGHAKAGWQVTVDEPTDAQVESVDPTGTAAIAAGEAVIHQAPAYSTTIIQNNVEYIEVLEEGRREGSGKQVLVNSRGGTYARRQGATGSIQAPRGMLGVTLEELATEMESVEVER